MHNVDFKNMFSVKLYLHILYVFYVCKSIAIPDELYPTVSKCNRRLTSRIRPENLDFSGFWKVIENEMTTSIASFKLDETDALQIKKVGTKYDGIFQVYSNLNTFAIETEMFNLTVEYVLNRTTCNLKLELNEEESSVMYSENCPICNSPKIICDNPPCVCGSMGRCTYNRSITTTCQANGRYLPISECSGDLKTLLLMPLGVIFTSIAMILLIGGIIQQKVVLWQCGFIVIGIGLIFIGIGIYQMDGMLLSVILIASGGVIGGVGTNLLYRGECKG